MTALSELINDEEDDELSEKAFETLEMLGPEVVTKLANKLEAIYEERRSFVWRRQRTIILDIH